MSRIFLSEWDEHVSEVARSSPRFFEMFRKMREGKYLFVRRKGHAVPGRPHSFHGKIIAVLDDGEAIRVEFYSELGKHIEVFKPNEALYYLCN